MPDPTGPDLRAPRFLSSPFRPGGAGVPQTVGEDAHLRELILQVLFTSPGERVMLPEFGAGVHRLVFEPNGPLLQSGVQFLVATQLRRWLGDRIDVERVTAESVPGDEQTLVIDIAYAVRATRDRQRLRIQV